MNLVLILIFVISSCLLLFLYSACVISSRCSRLEEGRDVIEGNSTDNKK